MNPRSQMQGSRSRDESGERVGPRVWLEDIVAGSSGAVLLAIGAMGWYLNVHRDLVRAVAHSHSYWVAGMVLLGLALALILGMWGWMMADCIAQLVQRRSPRLVAWLGVMIVIYLAAWAYYLVEKRPRRSFRNRDAGPTGAVNWGDLDDRANSQMPQANPRPTPGASRTK